METNELERELTTKIKIPKGIREVIYDKLFKNLSMAILVLLYFIFVYMGYIKLRASVFEEDLHVFAGILIILTIVSFEMSYRKNNIEIAIHGVELLFLSIVTLFMPYIYFHRGNILKFTYSFVSIYVTVYYLVKCLVIYIIEVKKYRDGLSDIKEIIEDEEEETYLDKPNERKFKDVDDEETTDEKIMDKKDITKKSTTKKNTIPKDTIEKTTTKKSTAKGKKTKSDVTEDEMNSDKKVVTKKTATKKATTKNVTTKKESAKVTTKKETVKKVARKKSDKIESEED